MRIQTMLGATALTLALLFGFASMSVTWTDRAAAAQGQDQGMKGDKKGQQKGSQEQSNKKSIGPHGESETGGAGPSGPAPLPPSDKSPGFEGANKDKSKAPTAGGPR